MFRCSGGIDGVHGGGAGVGRCLLSVGFLQLGGELVAALDGGRKGGARVGEEPVVAAYKRKEENRAMEKVATWRGRSMPWLDLCCSSTWKGR
jgi:hypothetical protein